MPIGARIRPEFERPDPALVKGLAACGSSDLADAMGRLHTVDASLRSLGVEGRLCGPALTVLTHPDDNLMIHAAIDLARPGDVIVVSGGGGLQTALVGEMVVAWAKERGVAGFIIDGAVRDVEALSLPVYARGSSPRAPFKVAPGEVGYPVGLGGLAVMPGDIVLADADGVVVIPREDGPLVLKRAQAVLAGDVEARAAMASGTYDRSWVAKALFQAGVDLE